MSTVEVGCRDFLRLGTMNVPVDQIVAIDLRPVADHDIAYIHLTTTSFSKVEVTGETYKQLVEFIYSRV